jgi:hypothetical protein
MEIQGSWIPLDVLKYITQFLWVKDHREDFKRVCRVFYRALKEDPPKPGVYIVPEYTFLEHGIITRVWDVTCYTDRLKVRAFAGNNNGLVRYEVRPPHRPFTIFRQMWRRPDALNYPVWHLEQGDLEHINPSACIIGYDTVLQSMEDGAAVAEEMRRLYHIARRYLLDLQHDAN